MTNTEITQQRLLNQQLTTTDFINPKDLVAHLGAVQSQDYGGAKWALGQRLKGTTDAAIDRAYDEGAILRTHVLRPTWHFVAPADIRWMLALSGPRINALHASRNRELGLDEATLTRSNKLIEQALQGGKQLTRTEIATQLQQAGLPAHDSLQVIHIMFRAELEGIVCSGPRQGKQFTYMLLEERVPPAKALLRDEALAALTFRFFNSRGPATLPDFVWWSGLTMADAKAGLDMVKSRFIQEIAGGVQYWLPAQPMPVKTAPPPVAYLLPNYDEYIVGYKDRSAIFDHVHLHHLDSRGNVLFNNTIVLDGRVAGTWKRTLRKSSITLEGYPFHPLDQAARDVVALAANRYGAFMDTPVSCSIS